MTIAETIAVIVVSYGSGSLVREAIRQRRINREILALMESQRESLQLQINAIVEGRLPR